MGLGWRSLAKPQATPRVKIRRKTKPVASCGVGLERVCQGKGYDGDLLPEYSIMWVMAEGPWLRLSLCLDLALGLEEKQNP